MPVRAQSRSTAVRRRAGLLMLCLAGVLVAAAAGDEPPPSPRFGKPAPLVAPDVMPRAVLAEPQPAAETVVEPPRPVAILTGVRPLTGEPDEDAKSAVAVQAVPPGTAPVPPPKSSAADEELDLLQLKPPRPDRLFRLESEQAMRERIRKEAQANPKLPRPEFPPEGPPSAGTLTPRIWPWYTWAVEPNYLCHGRLFFEQTLAERYGRDFGPLHPLLSGGLFYYDLATFPLRALLWPCRPYECHHDDWSPFFDGWPTRH